MTVEVIEGPLISASDLATHRQLFCSGFMMEEVAHERLDHDATARLFGIAGHKAETVTLRTPGTPFGTRLIALAPGSSDTIRTESRGRDRDALKVIDFYARDFEQGLAHIEKAGFKIRGEIAEYANAHGVFREAHIWGPDAVVCAVISGPPGHIDDVATVTDRLFSEPHSMSGPVTSLEKTQRFLELGLGLAKVSGYELEDDSFDAMVGSTAKIRLRASNMGLSKKTPYFGVIDYGLPPDTAASLADRARLPNVGLLGAALRVTHIEEMVTRCVAHGATVLAPVADTGLDGMGAARTAFIAAPFGVSYFLIQENE